MLCFRDMTFCTYWENCRDSETCHRKFDDVQKAAARKWWGGDDPPVCTYVDRPRCFVEKTCNCSMRTRFVGDGCEVCNPEYAEQFKNNE